MDKVINEVLNTYSDARDKWSKSTKQSVKALKFVLGNQWSSEEKAYLAKTGRPDDVVYNKLLPRLNNLIGLEQQNRRSIKIRSARAEFDDMAELMNYIFIAISNDSRLEESIGNAFKTGLITTLPAFIEIGTELNDKSFEEYTFNVANSFMVTPDPTFKDYFLRDCDWIIKEKWMTKEDIEEKYGETLKEKTMSWWESLVSPNNIYTVWDKSYPQNEYYDKAGKKFKVLEQQTRVNVKRYTYMDRMTGEYVDLPEKDTGNKDMIFVSETSRKRIHIKTIVPYANKVLLDELSKYETAMYDVIPYMSFDYNHIKSESDSFINSLIPIQKSFNKREVQYLSFLDHSISAPVFFNHADKETKEEYDRIGNKPNASFLYRSSKTPPFRLQPNQVPYSIKEKLVDDEQNMNDISAINDAMRGQSEYSDESGRLFNMKNAVAGVTANHYFNNLSKTRKMIGEYILDTIGQVYGDSDRLANIMNDKGERKEIILNMDMGDNRLNDVVSFKGKVFIDEGQKSVTYREEKFMQKMQLVNLFGMQMINPEWLLKDSELPDWEEQVEYMKMVMGIESQNQAEERALAENGEILNQLSQEKALNEEPSE